MEALANDKLALVASHEAVAAFISAFITPVTVDFVCDAAAADAKVGRKFELLSPCDFPCLFGFLLCERFFFVIGFRAAFASPTSRPFRINSESTRLLS